MKHVYAGGVGFLVLGMVVVSHTGLGPLTNTTYDVRESISSAAEDVIAEVTEADPIDTRERIGHVPMPEQVKAIYMTACVAGTPSFRDSLVALIERTEVNSVVIDIKDFSGTISFPPEAEVLKPAWGAAGCGTRGMKEFIATLHEKDIFVIGRITVFQDPFYTGVRPELAVKKASDGSVWKDYKKLSFIDVGAREYWDYILTLSEESYNIGFDELNFDYVRYPSDGPMDDIAFPLSVASEHGSDKQANLEAFFAYLSSELGDPARYKNVVHENTGRDEPAPYLSVDLFGMTTTNTDDLSIGQILERAAPYFDVIAPMVYPSHYPKTFLGLGNPNNYPYEVVNYAMSSGVDRMTASTTVVDGFVHERIGTSTPFVYKKPVYTADNLRTWIQDFDYGGDYDANDVRAQIEASYNAGVDSWMIWAPSNIYTEPALLPAVKAASTT